MQVIRIFETKVVRKQSASRFLAPLSLVILLAFIPTFAKAQAPDSVSVDTVASQEKNSGLGKRLVGKLTKHYFKVKYDSNYVIRPQERWLLKLSGNQSGTSIHAKGTVKDVWSKYNLHTSRNTTVSLEVDFCDIALTLSLNPAKWSGSYKDYEFNFEYHGNRISFDLDYQRATSLRGDINFGNIDRLNEDALDMKVFTLTAYYTFSHSRFSFPAAFYQNYMQKRSAGSWLAGMTFQSGSIRTTGELKERNPQAPDVHIRAAHLGIGGGYGYNFVFGNRAQWLFHLSALPTVVVYNHNELTVNGERQHAKRMRFNMIFNERAALVYHFKNPRYFAGTSFMMSNSVFDDKAVVINQNKWMVRAFVGMRI